MALLHHQREDAEADEGGEDRRDRSGQRDDDRAEGHGEDEEGDADDVEEEERQPLQDPVGDVVERGGQAGHVRDRVAALRGCGHDVVAKRWTRSAVASSCGAESGVTKTIATVSSSLNCGSPTEATPSAPWTPS